MQIKVVYYGALKEITGAKYQTLDFGDQSGMTISDLLQALAARYPRLNARLDTIAYVVDDELVDPDYALKDGDEAGLLPPVSGG
jgi:MoaD family protein